MALTAAQLNSIKQRVKAEMARRNGYGSLAEYAGSAYDYSDVPAKDSIIIEEHGKKAVDLLLKIEDIPNLQNVNQGDKITSGLDNAVITAQLSKLEKETMEGKEFEEIVKAENHCAALTQEAIANLPPSEEKPAAKTSKRTTKKAEPKAEKSEKKSTPKKSAAKKEQ